MLRIARVGPRDLVYDLGSGDGRIVIAAAARHGARAVGVEKSAGWVRYSRQRAREAGVTGRVRFVQQNFFETDLRAATVVALYLYKHINLKLRPRLLEQLRPGSRVVSHRFDMGEWKPDYASPIGGPRVFLWIVPARVGGEWRWRRSPLGPGTLRIEQRFQKIKASLRLGGRPATIERASLRGTRLTLVVHRAGRKFTMVGELLGKVLSLSAQGSTRRWTAHPG